jgi:hypothetical protein
MSSVAAPHLTSVEKNGRYILYVAAIKVESLSRSLMKGCNF